jgi:hypothetical protein
MTTEMKPQAIVVNVARIIARAEAIDTAVATDDLVWSGGIF